MLPEIQKRVLAISQGVHKGALVFNRVLLHCLNNNLQFPDLTDPKLYQQCIRIGTGKSSEKLDKTVEMIWNTYFKNFPNIARYTEDSNSIVDAAKKYQTNFKNSLIFAFQGRQKKFIKTILRTKNQNENLWYSIACYINGWDCKTVLTPDLMAFVKTEQEILKATVPITREWLGNHSEQVVKYYYHILQELEKIENSKKFTLAPLCRIKSHFLTIDSTVLYGILGNLKPIKTDRSKFIKEKATHWPNYFKFQPLSKHEFTYYIQTDGVSVCVHYLKPKKIKSEIKSNPNKRVIAIDPGRSNLIYGVEKLSDNSTKKYTLTRQSYYNRCGMKEAKKNTAKWEKTIKAEEDLFAQVSLRTTNEDHWRQFLSNYLLVYNRLWGLKTKRKWGQQRFRTYRLRRRCLDKFFASMKGKDQPTPVIAYGSAKFNPNSKNELSAPTTSLSKKCGTFYPTIMVDEFRTTKICYNCDCQLHPVGYNKKGEDGSVSYREIRGLRWCSSTKCRKFKNRDMNAALNILRCYLAGEQRPKGLGRNESALPKIKSVMITRHDGHQGA